MSSIESFDGLCGIIYRMSTSEQQVRCKYKFGHDGPHSWEKNLSSGPIILLVHEVKFK